MPLLASRLLTALRSSGSPSIQPPNCCFQGGAFIVLLLTCSNAAAGGMIGAIICAIFFAFWRRTCTGVAKAFLKHTFPDSTLHRYYRCYWFCPDSAACRRMVPQAIFFVLPVLLLDRLSLGATCLVLPSCHWFPFEVFTRHLPQSRYVTAEGPPQGINYLLPLLMMAGGGQVGAGL